MIFSMLQTRKQTSEAKMTGLDASVLDLGSHLELWSVRNTPISSNLPISCARQVPVPQGLPEVCPREGHKTYLLTSK